MKRDAVAERVPCEWDFADELTLVCLVHRDAHWSIKLGAERRAPVLRELLELGRLRGKALEEAKGAAT